ncbi:MAG TPA: ArsI/CadI family heavy metal resistance metalloenzyme [Pyrinomonadaceae bacterium]|jgi:catechol 2,3-dioxygenase-like lactoylglutathione lyase family enzyme
MSEETGQQREVQALKAHLALNVRNVEGSIEFYRKMLGLEPSKVRPGYAKFDVQNPPLNLTLNQVSFKERGALSHLGIQVASTADVLSMRERWIERGLDTRDEMQTNCCYAMQDKTWVQDPDGNEWEVFVVLEDNLLETAMCCTTDATVASEQANDAAATSSSTGSSTAASSSCAPVAAGAGQAESSSSCCSTSTSAEPVAISR